MIITNTVAGRMVRLGLLVLLAIAGSAASLRAAELVMFEEQGCPWCERWHREVGFAYPKTEEGRRAPLRRVEIARSRDIGVRLAGPVTASPTFVLVEDGREVGRIVGHPGADFFWGLLGDLLAKLDRGTSPRHVGGSHDMTGAVRGLRTSDAAGVVSTRADASVRTRPAI